MTSELFFGQIVGDVNEAIDYINRFGSSHTYVIISEDKELQDRFLQQVKNCSLVCVPFSHLSFVDGYTTLYYPVILAVTCFQLLVCNHPVP